jgi:predicted nucleic acid-binding protein
MTGWLVDTSALVRLGSSPDADEWASRIQRGLVRISTLTRLEVGYSARTADDLAASGTRVPLSSMPIEYLTPAIEDTAMAVQSMLAFRGHHRGASVPDLLIAACAELVGLAVLHLDRDFELIADVTGQAAERLRLN